MTAYEIKEIWYKQLACDYSCTVEELTDKAPILKKKAYHPARRIFRGDDCFLKILVVNGKLVVNADDEAFLSENRVFFENASAAWFFEPDNIRTLDKMLAKYGHEVADTHHFYLPLGTAQTVTDADCLPDIDLRESWVRGIDLNDSAKTGALHWYEKADLEVFRGDDRFKDALSFILQSPDMLAVTWEENGEILGMAGASADAESLWQIGINVLPGGEHRGMGTLLVTQLKEEILKRGKVPFYGTAESHIRSQRVAVQSGFVPAWAELYTKRI
ncbi:MAG: GNAT family N-acetyltransferase [Lachnospiraceae bacterium]|nr:GNAT family N-acetyltransferase [Lachnospiraceae bacterium]